MGISPRARLEALFDGGVFVEVEVPEPITDPLSFKDQKKYPDRMKAAQKKTGEPEAMLVSEGEIGRTGIIAAAQDFAFMGGSMGMYVGNAIIAAAQRAVQLKRPLVLFSAAGGARMQEAIISLMQMSKTAAVLERMKQEGIPYVSVMTDPVFGGVSASLAMLGDLNIAEPYALIGFAGPRVIEQTVREKLPEGFQRSEFLLDHGAIDMILHRHLMRGRIAALLAKFSGLEQTEEEQPIEFEVSEITESDAPTE